jgi:hypothetical protein
MHSLSHGFLGSMRSTRGGFIFRREEPSMRSMRSMRSICWDFIFRSRGPLLAEGTSLPMSHKSH